MPEKKAEHYKTSEKLSNKKKKKKNIENINKNGKSNYKILMILKSENKISTKIKDAFQWEILILIK